MVFALILLAVLAFFFVFFLKHPLSNIDKAQKEVDDIVRRTVGYEQYLQEHGVVIRKEFTSGDIRFIIDDVHRALYIASFGTPFTEILFHELRDVEVSQDAPSYETKSANTVGRAIIGGAIAGSAGAIVGAATAKRRSTPIDGKFYLTIYTTSIDHPQLTICTRDRAFVSGIKGAIGAIMSDMTLSNHSVATVYPPMGVADEKLPPLEETWCIFCHGSVSSNGLFCPICKKTLSDSTKVIRCRNCGKLIVKSESICRHCGHKGGG